MSTRHKGRRDKDYAMMHKAGQSPNNLKRFKGSSELQKHSSVKSKLGFADSDDDGNEDDEEGENEQEEEQSENAEEGEDELEDQNQIGEDNYEQDFFSENEYNTLGSEEFASQHGGGSPRNYQRPTQIAKDSDSEASAPKLNQQLA